MSNYRNHWISPYEILERVCFWEKDKDVFYNLEELPGHKYDFWVNFLNPICQGLQKFIDVVHPEVRHVKIDRWDTWSMDSMLAQIILPMLRQLKEQKHGAPHVNDRDVPKELRSTTAPPKENSWDTDDLWFDRWNWVLDQMIWSFEQLQPDADWEGQFHSGTHERKHVACEWDENGKPTMFEWKKGPNDTSQFDAKGHKAYNARIQKGLELFGKYFRDLWT
jgi:hypothetical protein